MKDYDGDRILGQERADRALERADSPLTHLDTQPQQHCRECGYLPREVEPGRWICPCDQWNVAA